MTFKRSTSLAVTCLMLTLAAAYTNAQPLPVARVPPSETRLAMRPAPQAPPAVTTGSSDKNLRALRGRWVVVTQRDGRVVRGTLMEVRSKYITVASRPGRSEHVAIAQFRQIRPFSVTEIDSRLLRERGRPKLNLKTRAARRRGLSKGAKIAIIVTVVGVVVGLVVTGIAVGLAFRGWTDDGPLLGTQEDWDG